MLEDLTPAFSSSCSAWSLARTTCLVLPETFRRMRFPSGPYPSETAPMYRFLEPHPF